MISTFTAFFDANVFYGARLRSLVLFLAQTKLFRARWSEAVHDEWVANLLRNRPDLDAASLQRTRNAMNDAVPDCVVEGYESLMTGLSLPDPDDRHVLAAAIMTRASVIVTFNLDDFPAAVLSPCRLHAKHPDDFLCETFNLAPELFLQAVQGDFLHYRKPALTYESYLASLRKAGTPRLAELLASYGVLMPTNDAS